jgi:putative nucleotidyltransferase with HDIG domain
MMNTIQNVNTDTSLEWTFQYCPQAPNWQIDWNLILTEFSDIKALANCQQDPIYHAEGDVLTHTQMVCEALVKNPAWRQLSVTERSLVFAAALFHDIAKPSTTEIGEDGRLHARGHGKKGANMVREIFQDLNTPFFIREAIVSIVEMGSLPLWFWDRDNPQKSVIKASQIVRCDWLAMMAEADVRGRICHDGDRLLDSIDLFGDFCREWGCYDKPFEFASAHSRFIYFQKEAGDPFYQAYDDREFDVFLTCALSGTGKDYWISQNKPDLPMVSLDELRAKLGIDPTDEQSAVIQAAKTAAKSLLQAKTSFVWNATNISRTTRRGLIESFANYGARATIVYLEIPYSRTIFQNNHRDRQVPRSVIDRFRRRLDMPNLTECHTIDWQIGEYGDLK